MVDPETQPEGSISPEREAGPDRRDLICTWARYGLLGALALTAAALLGRGPATATCSPDLCARCQALGRCLEPAAAAVRGREVGHD